MDCISVVGAGAGGNGGHGAGQLMPIPVVIDTDGGVDDAVALWWAATNPDIDLLAVTVVWGNVSLAVASDAVLRVLHAAGRSDVPVAIGLDGPIGPAPETRAA